MHRAVRAASTLSFVLGAMLAIAVIASWFTTVSFNVGTSVYRRGLTIDRGYAVLLAPDVTRNYSHAGSFPPQLPKFLAKYANDSVHWDTPYGVLHPWVQADVVAHGTWIPPDELPHLLPALNDPDRFVLAHVLLSGSTRAGRYATAEAAQKTTLNEYCGLRVIGPLNAPRYDPSQIPVLREMWRRSLYEPRVEVMWLSLHWPVILLIIPSIALGIGRAYWRARQARMVGRCRNCFYDLTGNTSGV